MFTYLRNKNPDWDSKLRSLQKPREVTTKAMIHGITNEPNAINCYEKWTGRSVEKLGLVVLPHMPWAGFSPDGVVWKEKILIEVKCPVAGKEATAMDVIETLPWLNRCLNNNYVLKQNHAYYGQVQWGMGILNFQQCDFVIYCPYDDSCYVISIPLDTNFTTTLIQSLKGAYFTKVLPFLCNEISS